MLRKLFLQRSVLAKELHSTLWPTIMRSDSAGTKNVNWRVNIVTKINFVFSCLLFITGIITPLGLKDSIVPSRESTAKFVYMRDYSDFGNGTMRRPSGPPSRDCLAHLGYLCPGMTISGNDTNPMSTSAVPEEVTTMFSSASRNSTVAGFFDIQYRSWVTTTSDTLDAGKQYLRGLDRYVDNLLSSGAGMLLKEGVIVDVTQGGIGFRNHSAPADLAHGASWSEDILWLEPDISCTSNNLSLHVELGESKDISYTNATAKSTLVDDGGFALLGPVNAVQGWPMLNTSQPDVRFLSKKSAQLHNILAAMLYNLTDAKNAKYGINVTAGTSYPVSTKDVNADLEFQTFDFDGSYIVDFMNTTYTNGTLKINGSTVADPNDYPRELGFSLFLEVSRWCEGQFNSDSTPARQFNVLCGQMFGVPERTDNGEVLLQDPGSKWKMPISTCAGALKASIREMSFSTNGSSSLEFVTVAASKEKPYGSAKECPVWAYEDYGKNLLSSNSSSKNNASTVPLWGIVDGSYIGTPGYNFIQSPNFYLPQTYEYTYAHGRGAPFDMSAAAAAPMGILEIVMQGVSRASGLKGADYTGSDSVALSNKWRLLSERAGGQDTALRLIWTDLMANAVIGTNRGPAPTAASHASDDLGQRSVVPYRRRIVYDMRYAIPALVALATWAVLLLGALVISCIHPRIYTRLRHMLNDTSIGRVATSHAQAQKPLSRASTKEWQKNAGSMHIILGTYEPDKGDNEAPTANTVPLKNGGITESTPIMLG